MTTLLLFDMEMQWMELMAHWPTTFVEMRETYSWGLRM